MSRQANRPGPGHPFFCGNGRLVFPSAQSSVKLRIYSGIFISRSNVMNSIIYIVGLIVVIGFVASFFGLR